jgi:hypothetical protein
MTVVLSAAKDLYRDSSAGPSLRAGRQGRSYNPYFSGSDPTMAVAISFGT